MKINMEKLENYVREDMIMEFESDEACKNWYNIYDFQDFKTVQDMLNYLGKYTFKVGDKRYAINTDDALDVFMETKLSLKEAVEIAEEYVDSTNPYGFTVISAEQNGNYIKVSVAEHDTGDNLLTPYELCVFDDRIENIYGDILETFAKEVISGSYSRSTDTTFVLKEKYFRNKLLSREVVGFVHGYYEDDCEVLAQYVGKLSAEYSF